MKPSRVQVVGQRNCEEDRLGLQRNQQLLYISNRVLGLGGRGRGLLMQEDSVGRRARGRPPHPNDSREGGRLHPPYSLTRSTLAPNLTSF